ncbi:hypothetical protein BTO32_15150 [Marinobacter lutaoensis]|uniref:DUF4142 domain-containing protein n=1 Tax=Marinobacter lutaoensis TaxID=135739 RepID=A0A1V2DPG2_9GAMM|nr:hypothetical protein [Marinobacter lutaoensis]ONF42543.1 hypothetical protein BTO32_15150 [Marinobacter lutaoensis]
MIPFRTSLAVLAFIVSGTATAQQNIEDFHQLTETACATHKNSIIAMVEQMESGVSPEAIKERGEARIGDNQRRQLVRQILEQTASAEQNPVLRQRLEYANQAYFRSGRLDDFKRALNGFVDECVRLKSHQVGEAVSRSREMINQLAPEQTKPTKPDGSNLPSRKSYF